MLTHNSLAPKLNKGHPTSAVRCTRDEFADACEHYLSGIRAYLREEAWNRYLGARLYRNRMAAGWTPADERARRAGQIDRAAGKMRSPNLGLAIGDAVVVVSAVGLFPHRMPGGRS